MPLFDAPVDADEVVCLYNHSLTFLVHYYYQKYILHDLEQPRPP